MEAEIQTQFESLIQDCEESLRAGRGHTLRQRLSELNTSRVPRQFRKPLANICRRAGLNRTGLRLLSNIVRSDNSSFEPAPSDGESAEYGLLLSRVGLLREAEEVLKKVDPSVAPEALLYLSHIHFTRWEYKQALPLLERYLCADLPTYQLLVGRVNHVAALVHTYQHAEAETLIQSTISEVVQHKHYRLWANLLELRIENFVISGDLKSAEHTLLETEELRKLGIGGIDLTYIDIWDTIVSGLSKRDTKPLLEVRKEVLKNGLWERVRELDLYICKIQEMQNQLDETQYGFLYFGSPQAGFRERIKREIRFRSEATEFILGDKQAPCLDVVIGNHSSLKVGKKVHQLLVLLTRDFYRPTSLGNLFSHLYPGEVFSLSTSPTRVHQVVNRSRRWLMENDIPIQLTFEDGGLRATLAGPISLRVPLHHRIPDTNSANIERIQRIFPKGSEVSAKEVRLLLGLKTSSTKNFLSWAVEQGHFERIGESVRTTYRVR